MTTGNRVPTTKKNFGDNIKGITLDGDVIWDPQDLAFAVKAYRDGGWGRLKPRSKPKQKKVQKVKEYKTFEICPNCKFHQIVWKEVEA